MKERESDDGGSFNVECVSSSDDEVVYGGSLMPPIPDIKPPTAPPSPASPADQPGPAAATDSDVPDWDEVSAAEADVDDGEPDAEPEATLDALEDACREEEKHKVFVEPCFRLSSAAFGRLLPLILRIFLDDSQRS